MALPHSYPWPGDALLDVVERIAIERIAIGRVNEASRSISRTARWLAIARSTLRARVEPHGLRSRVDVRPLQHPARQPAVLEPAGSLEGQAPPGHPPR
jgi:hypothetical protein